MQIAHSSSYEYLSNQADAIMRLTIDGDKMFYEQIMLLSEHQWYHSSIAQTCLSTGNDVCSEGPIIYR